MKPAGTREALSGTNSLHDCERGAIMLLGLLFAIFATSLLVMTLGTVQTVLLKERAQDAADASALSGAIMGARCMNLIVLTNIVMAAILAVLVALKLIESLAIIGIAIAAALAYPTWGASLAFIPPLGVLQEKVHGIYEELKPPIENALEVLHEAAGLIADAGGPAGRSVAKAELEAASVPGAHFAVGAALELPVEDDTYARLCGEAGQFPIKMTEQTLGPLGLGIITAPLGEATKALTSSLSEWFCGDENAASPSYDQTQGAWFPEDESAASCRKSDAVPGANGSALGANSPECTNAKETAEASAPDKSSGRCRSGKDCSESGPYELKAALAREVCEPTKSPAPTKYSYQLRRGGVEYKKTKTGYQRGTQKFTSSTLVESTQPPCGPASVHPQYSQDYNLTSRKTAGAPLLPLCTTERPPTDSLRQRITGQDTIIVRFEEVTRLFACEIPTELHGDVDVDRLNDTDSKSPKKIASDAERGDETFEIRTLVQAPPVPSGFLRIVELAAWGHKEEKPHQGPELPSPFGLLRGFSVAQSEYYFDGAEPRDAWMWNMGWRARLVRFNAEGDRLKSLGADCLTPDDFDVEAAAEFASSCAAYLAQLRNSHALIAH